MLTAEPYFSGTAGSIQLWGGGLRGTLGDCTAPCSEVSCDGSPTGNLCCYCPKATGFRRFFSASSTRMAGTLGDSSLSSTAVGVLLGSAALIAIFGFVASREGRRTGAEREAHAIMNPRSDRPWAKKGVFRGAINLLGFGRSRSRSRRRGRGRR